MTMMQEANKSSANKETIAFYSDPSGLGGSEVYLKALLGNIDYLKYDVLFFCPPEHPLYNYAKENQRIRMIHINVPGNNQVVQDVQAPSIGVSGNRKKNIKQIIRDRIPLTLRLFVGTIKEIKRLIKLFKKYPIDLIHFNDTGCEPPVVAARLAGIPHVIGTLHVLPSYEKEKMTWVHRLIEYLSLRSMHAIIAVSQATKAAWIQRTSIKAEKLEVIYNGIDLRVFDIDVDILKAKASLGISSSSRVIGVPARLHPMKGHKYLFEALVEVIKYFPDLKVLLVGDGPLKNKLQESAMKFGIDRNVTFLGHRSDMPVILSLVDFIVLPSVAETFSLAAIEAMACRKAVIATEFGGFPEVVADGVTGILVPPGDSSALTDAFIDLLNNQEKRTRMGRAGRKKAEEMFGEDKMLRKTFRLYEENLSK